VNFFEGNLVLPMSDCDVFVGQPIVLDYEVYQLWIKGNSRSF